MQEGERACDDLNWAKSEESLTTSLAHTHTPDGILESCLTVQIY